MQNNVTAIIVAGGSGKRMGTKVPKQFLKLAGKPIIIHTLEKFEKSRHITDIVVVCREDYIKTLERLIRKHKVSKIYKIVPGGKTRQMSSFNGLKASPPGTKYVLIHDAVRPFVSGKIIKEVLGAAKKYGAAGCAIDVTDTIVEVDGGLITNIPERKKLKRIQTPQGFSYGAIKQAHEKAARAGIEDATDDCGLTLAADRSVRLVQGSEQNIKITKRDELFPGDHFILKKNRSRSANDN